MAPNHRRGPWIPEEDQALLHLVREQGPNNWVRISQHMHFRSPKQCRERFHQNLKPSLNHAPISAEEGMMIERMVNEMGKRWAEIARRLGNRSDNAVKNWWNGSMNRKKRGLVIQTHAQETYSSGVGTPYPQTSMTVNSPAEQSQCQSTMVEMRQSTWTPVKAHSNSSPVSVSQLLHDNKSPSPSPYPESERRESYATSTPEVDCLHDRRRRSLHADWDHHPQRRLASIFTFTGNHIVDSAITSPAFSEASYTPSLEPPSMVSDHNSISSASPRTASSPQPLPLAIDRRQSYSGRRESASAIQFNSPTTSSANDERINFGTSFLISGSDKSTEGLPEKASMRRCMPDFLIPSATHDLELGCHYSAFSTQIPHPWATRQEKPWVESNPSRQRSPRDSRMGLESLLN